MEERRGAVPNIEGENRLRVGGSVRRYGGHRLRLDGSGSETDWGEPTPGPRARTLVFGRGPRYGQTLCTLRERIRHPGVIRPPREIDLPSLNAHALMHV